MAKLIKYNQVMYIKEYYLYRFILNSKKKNAKKISRKKFFINCFPPTRRITVNQKILP